MSINIESIKKELLNNKHPNLGMAQFKNDERIYGSIAVEALKVGNVRKWSELIVAFVFEANGGRCLESAAVMTLTWSGLCSAPTENFRLSSSDQHESKACSTSVFNAKSGSES